MLVGPDASECLRCPLTHSITPWLQPEERVEPLLDCGSVLVIQDGTESIASGRGDAVTDERCMRAQTFGPRCTSKGGWKSLETPSEFVASFELLWNAMKV